MTKGRKQAFHYNVEEYMRKLLLLVRISKPAYNKTLYQDYKIYMNRQKNFRDPKYNHGQHDKYEGAILRGPCDVKYFEDGKEKQVHLNNYGIMYKENNAYVFCMYEIEFNQKTYDKENNKFYHDISWDYIKPLWDEDGLEMMIIKNTSVFFKKFSEAADKERKNWAKGLVKYDLQDKLQDKAYFEKALKDDFESVYHKIDDYKEQKEYRLTIDDDSGKDFFILPLENDNSLMFDFFTLEYGKNIIVEISNLEFDPQTNMPNRFSAKLRYAEPVNPIETL